MRDKKKNNNITQLFAYSRDQTSDIAIELWQLIEDDLIYILGIKKSFEMNYSIDFKEYEYIFFERENHNLNIICQNQNDDYLFKHPLLSDNSITYEIEINFKDDHHYLSDNIVSSDLHFLLDENFQTIRIFYNLNVLGNIKHIDKIKRDFVLCITNKTQECINTKQPARIKSHHLLLVDSIFEEIIALTKIADLTFNEARHEVIFFHKKIFENKTFEDIQKFNENLDALYEKFLCKD